MNGFDGVPDCRLAWLMELMFLAVRDSQWLNESQKRIMESKLQDMADTARS